MVVREFFAKNISAIMPKLKTPLKRKRFATIKTVKEKSKEEMLAIAKSAFRKVFVDYFSVFVDWEK